MVVPVLTLLIVLAAASLASTAENCTLGFPDLSALRESAAVENAGSCASTVCGYYRMQVFIPAVNFTCHGNVTGWFVGGEITDVEDDGWPQVQLWRPMTGADGVYSLVQSASIVVQQAAELNSTNVYESVMERPLEVQPGDVIGVFQDRRRVSSFSVYYQRTVGHLNYIIGDNTMQAINISISDLENGTLTRTALPLLTPIVSIPSSTPSINPLVSATQVLTNPSPLPTSELPESQDIDVLKFTILAGGIAGGFIALTAVAVLATTSVCVVRRKRRRRRRKVNLATIQERSDDYVELDVTPQSGRETINDSDSVAVLINDSHSDSVTVLIDDSHTHMEKSAPIVMKTNLAYHTHSREALLDSPTSPQYCEIDDMFTVPDTPNGGECPLDGSNEEDYVIRELVYEDKDDVFPTQNDEGDYVIRELVYENNDDMLQRGASTHNSEPQRGEHGYLKLLSSSELEGVPEYAEVYSEGSNEVDMYASIDPESVALDSRLLALKRSSSFCELYHSYEQVEFCASNSQ